MPSDEELEEDEASVVLDEIRSSSKKELWPRIAQEVLEKALKRVRSLRREQLNRLSAKPWSKQHDAPRPAMAIDGRRLKQQSVPRLQLAACGS